MLRRFLVLTLALLVAHSAAALTTAQRTVATGLGFIPIPTVQLNFGGSAGAISCFVKGVMIAAANCYTVTRSIVGTGHTADYAQWRDGHWSAFTANVQRVTDLGTLNEQAATNVIIHSRDWTGVTWVGVTMTRALTGTGIDNTANSATLLTAGATNDTILQTPGLSSALRIFSLFIKRSGVGTGAISATIDGTNYTALDATVCFDVAGVGYAPNTSAFVRCWISGTVVPIVGLKFATNGDAAIVDGAQLEVPQAGAVTPYFPSSPMFTTTASFSRSVDNMAIASTALTALTGALGFPTISMEGKMSVVAPNSLNVRSIAVGTGAATEQISIFCSVCSGTSVNVARGSVQSGGITTSLSPNGTTPHAAGFPLSMAFRAKASSYTTTANGYQTGSSSGTASQVLPTWTAAKIGGIPGQNDSSEAYIARIRLWSGVALTDQQLLQVTRQ